MLFRMYRRASETKPYVAEYNRDEVDQLQIRGVVVLALGPKEGIR